MSDLENITAGLEGLAANEQAELLSQLEKAMTQTKSRFLADKRKQDLQTRYNTELNSLPLNGLSYMQRVRRLNELKAKYRAQGLEVW